MSAAKEHARQLLEYLKPDQVAALVGVMEVMIDPLSRKLASAPIEDENIDAEEEQAVARSKEWLQQHPGIPFEQVVADLGFTMEQVRRGSPQEDQKEPAA